jgi:signal transduction histidine kinase
MIKTLRNKFVMINMLLVFSVLAVVFTAIGTFNVRRIHMDVNMSLRTALDSTFFTYSIADGGRGEMPEIVAVTLRNDTFLAIVHEDGEIEFLSESKWEEYGDSIDDIVNKVLELKQSDGVLKEYGLRFMTRNAHGETRISFMELEIENAAIKSAVLSVVFIGIASMGAFFIISLFLSQWVLRPVERAWQQQRRFISDASHELKTPLTVILANTGILMSKPSATIDEQMKWLDSTKHEAVAMKELVDSLLFLAKSEGNEQKMVYETLNLSDIALNMALSMESVAFEKGILTDTSGIENDVMVEGDREQIKRLITILLDNAVKYSAKGRTIPIKIAAEGGKAVITVTNSGEIIPMEELPLIFDRFYRADKSRHKEGYGLGLAIAKSIVEKHGGNISAYSENGVTTFVVRLNTANL